MRKAVIITFVVLLAAAGVRAQENSDKLLRIASTLPLKMATFDPNVSSYSPHRDLNGLVFLSLVQNLKSGEWAGDAAVDWRFNDDGSKLHFFLRDDLKWSDGQPLEAKDFAVAIERTIRSDSKNEIKAFLRSTLRNGNSDAAILNSIHTPSPTELVLDLALPYTAFIGSFEVLHAYPAHVESTGLWIDHGPDLISSGPFVLADWDDNSAIFSPNLHYYDKHAIDLEKIEARSPGQMASVSEFIEGNADLLMGPLGSQRDWLTSQFDLTMVPHGGVRQFVSIVNAKSTILADPKIRRSLSLAINRDSLGEGLFGQTHQVPVGTIPIGLGGYSAETDLVNPQPETFDERLVLARSLMADAGYNAENRLSIRMMYANEVYGYREIVNFLKASWKDIFVDLDIMAEEHFWDSVNRYKDENFDLIQLSSSNNSPLDYITDYINNSELFSIGLADQAEIAELVTTARRATDGESMSTALQTLDAAVTKQFILIPIAINRSVILVKNYVDPSQDNHQHLRFDRLRLIPEKFPDSRP